MDDKEFGEKCLSKRTIVQEPGVKIIEEFSRSWGVP